jgi:hypothetical protein
MVTLLRAAWEADPWWRTHPTALLALVLWGAASLVVAALRFRWE